MSTTKKIIGKSIEILCIIGIVYMAVSALISLFFPTMLIPEQMLQQLKTQHGFDFLALSTTVRVAWWFLGLPGTFMFGYMAFLGIKFAKLFAQENVTSPAGLDIFIKLRRTIVSFWLYSLLVHTVSVMTFFKNTPTFAIAMMYFGSLLLMSIAYAAITAIIKLMQRNLKLQDEQSGTI